MEIESITLTELAEKAGIGASLARIRTRDDEESRYLQYRAGSTYINVEIIAPRLVGTITKMRVPEQTKMFVFLITLLPRDGDELEVLDDIDTKRRGARVMRLRSVFGPENIIDLVVTR